MAALELRRRIEPPRVNALQTRMPNLLNDACGDPIMRFALGRRQSRIQYVTGAVISIILCIKEGGRKQKNTYASGFGQPLREAGRIFGLAGDTEVERAKGAEEQPGFERAHHVAQKGANAPELDGQISKV